MSLRVRLVAGTMLVAAVGLLLAAVATYRLVESALVDSLDDQLVEARLDVLGSLAPEIAPHFGGGRSGRPRQFVAVAPGTYGQWISPTGDVRAVSSLFGGEGIPPPELPEDLGQHPKTGTHFFTARGQEGGPSYRVAVHHLEGGFGTLVVAQPLSDVESTLDRLLVIEGGVAAGALLIAGLLGLAVVRLGLRPLDKVVATADAITAGDLGQRVQDESTRTEVGHLGRAFNKMVGSLEESMRRTEESEQRIREFVADASHELRTPLTSLSGYSEMLERADLSEEDRELAGLRLREASGRMARLVDDMLTLVRLDEEPYAVSDRVDLCRIAQAAVDDVRAVDPGWPINLSVHADCHVIGDKDQLGRVVTNLLRNVQTHTPAGTPAGVNVLHEGENVVLEVWDRGPGIPAEVREQVFERFFRADKSRARARGGFGLGLSIVSSIVAAHGGDVVALDREGGGTMFRVELPAANPAVP